MQVRDRGCLLQQEQIVPMKQAERQLHPPT